MKRSPEGRPLLFIAPRQATFQIERDLLRDPDLHGYTRLQVLSFDHLARFVLSRSLPARVLSVEARVMVLRALLTRHQRDLHVFHASARLPGFAHQISDCISEFQRQRVTPAMLSATAEKLAHNLPLAHKLRDLALIFAGYRAWLESEGLHDPGSLLDLAAAAVRSGVEQKELGWAALWLDGFTDFTPQELTLLLALLPGCERATLAFCADSLDATADDSLFSWSITGTAAAQCCAAVRGLPGCSVTVERLVRGVAPNRFSNSPALAHLESAWESPVPFAGVSEISAALRVANCTDPEAEAAFAAQEILRHVRAGGRFRDCGVILRELAGYHDVIRRAFTRYEIPFFIDRREPVSHHPLLELTRGALRLAAFDWLLDDWLAVLKTGLVTEDDWQIDVLENEALERGWSGNTWRQPFTELPELPGAETLERFRKEFVPPFARFTDALRQHPNGPSGRDMGVALQQLWSDLGVMQTLDAWSASDDAGERPAAVHATIWEQMQDWVDDLALAFSDLRLDLREWIAVVDAGFNNFTVGVVPPALDQVLVGTVDRSRNPNLELAIVLGLNETVFPAPPARPVLLNESDREELRGQQLALGPPSPALLRRERYYGYIASTRARRRLVLSFSTFDAMDRKLNPSIFISRVQRMFPALEVEPWAAPATWLEAEHARDILPALIADEGAVPRSGALDSLRERIANLRGYSASDALSPAAAERLYGRELRTSITSLERFGECAFRFLVHSGLRAQERRLFQIDRKKLGDFQHRVLKEFHDQLQAEGKEWRDVAPAEARQRIARIAEEHARTYHHGLFSNSARQRFAVRQLSLALQDFIEVIVGWMKQYSFKPVASELRFGDEGDVPPWRLPLSEGRALLFNGSIDRVDLSPREDGAALCVVIDFKSSKSKKIDPLELHNGVQLQLPAYLNMLRRIEDPREHFGVSELKPAGLFYVSLKGSYKSSQRRDEVLKDPDLARREAYQHRGRFDSTALDLLDTGKLGDQFKYSLKKDGTPDSRCKDPMAAEEFAALLDAVEGKLHEFGERIFAGDASVAPYRTGTKVPCEFCDYRPVCRIDPWTHTYRSLEPVPKP